MRFTSFLTFGLIGSAFALPSPDVPDVDVLGKGKDKDGKSCGCLKKKDVKELTDVYTGLIGSFDAEVAKKYLTEDWTDWSQSISTFIGLPDGVPTFNKTSYIASQSNQQGPATPLKVEGEPVVDCTRFTFIWTSTFGAGKTARGMTTISATKKSGEWKMDRWDVEFNSLNWALNLGGYYCVFGKSFGNAASCAAPSKF